MSSLLEKPIVLSLNRNWQALGWITPKQAIVAMTGGSGSSPPALGICVTMDENGKLVESIPMKWDEWIKLPVREQDLSLMTTRGPIRIPTIVVRPGYAKMPTKAPKLNPAAIWERDGGRCAYSGDFVPRAKGSVDHVIPKARGGKDRWENLVWCRKDINTKKGCRSNEEAGLKLLRKPFAPKPLPVSATIKEAKRPEQVPFLT